MLHGRFENNEGPHNCAEDVRSGATACSHCGRNLASSAPSLPVHTSKAERSALEHEFKVDEQVQKFLELNHALTFFLVTAAVGTIGFTLTCLKELLPSAAMWPLVMVVVAAVAALGAAGAGLRALRCDQDSFRRHLQYRYQRKTWDALDRKEQDAWERLNSKAASSRHWSFKLLVATVVVQVIAVLTFSLDQGDLPMHHYGEDSTNVVVGESFYHVEFKNKVSGATITMNVPAVGALEDPKARLDPDNARRVANEVAHTLRRTLE